MQIYTRAGDDGSTALLGGERFSKADLRIETLGELDELNSWLGRCLAQAETSSPGRVAEQLQLQLRQIQSDLLTLGAGLAASAGTVHPSRAQGAEEAICRLERWIDEMTSQLPPLRHFLLPGGTLLAADVQITRTVCRRAERAWVRLMQVAGRLPPAAEGEALASAGAPAGAHRGGVSQQLPVAYLNRLSDYLFTVARWANQQQGVTDPEWSGGR